MLVFVALANRTYTVQYTDQIDPFAWNVFTNITAAPAERLIYLPIPTDTPTRFYRIRTP